MAKRSSVVYTLFYLFASTLLPETAKAELISVSVGVGSALALSGFLASYEYFKCKVYECCEPSWVHDDVDGLQKILKQRLYGQPLVHDTVVKSIRAHVANKEPRKALVLSFHGWTGNGKNYVANMIAESLYKKALKSKYVHLYITNLHFPDPSLVTIYQSQLRDWIRGNVTQCERSLFIFDELDKIEPRILTAVKPFLEHYPQIDGVDFRKSIFVFLSNTGGSDISKATLDNFKSGKAREDLTLTDMEHLIRKAAFNEEGGLRFSSLISNHLIDHFIPFLPLERAQVKLCVRDYLAFRNISRDVGEAFLNGVADSLEYFPSGSGGIYSTSGCKGVIHKTELLLQSQEEEQREHEEL